MLVLGSGISSVFSTLVPLGLYEAAGLVRMKRLRSDGLLSTVGDAWHCVIGSQPFHAHQPGCFIQSQWHLRRVHTRYTRSQY